MGTGGKMQMEVKKKKKERLADPVTRTNPLFKCLRMSGSGLERTGEQAHKGFPLGGNPPEQSQLSAPRLFHLPFFLLSMSQTRRKTERTEEGKSDMS